MNRHPLHAEVAWLRKNWPLVEVVNNTAGGYLVITVCLDEKGGQGRTFLQSQIDECIEYVKARLDKSQLELDLNT
jgi:hypothetical protein